MSRSARARLEALNMKLGEDEKVRFHRRLSVRLLCCGDLSHVPSLVVCLLIYMKISPVPKANT